MNTTIIDMYQVSPLQFFDEMSDMMGYNHQHTFHIKMEKNADGSITLRRYADADRRANWIEHYYQLAMCDSNVTIEALNHTIAVALISVTGCPLVAMSHPSRKDEYDEKTGIAVAMAKVLREPIPEFI